MTSTPRLRHWRSSAVRSCLVRNKEKRARVALLIDTDNASPTWRHEIGEAARSEGTIVHCMGFGRTRNAAWQKDAALPVLVWGKGGSQASGKNAADIDLAAAAVDLVHEGEVDCFCIVSGDSDFTGLATRLREAGKTVVGMGKRGKMSKAFQKACSRVEFVGASEGSKGAGDARRAAPKVDKAAKHKAKAKGKSRGTSNAAPRSTPKAKRASKPAIGERARSEFLLLVARATEAQPEAWRRVGWLGKELRKLEPGIRYSRYGKRTLGALLETFPEAIELRGPTSETEFRLKARAGERAPSAQEVWSTAIGTDETAHERHASPSNRLDDRWNAAVLDAKFGWLPGGCEDLAELTREEWDEVVREAEDRWAKVRKLKSEIGMWYERRNEGRQEPRGNEELVFFAGDERMDEDSDREILCPIVDLAAMPIPLTLAEIGSHGNGNVQDERMLRLNPILAAIGDQHDEDAERRRAARRTIAEHFAMVVGEPQTVVQRAAEPSVPGVSIAKVLVQSEPANVGGNLLLT